MSFFFESVAPLTRVFFRPLRVHVLFHCILHEQVAVQISTKTCGPCKVVYPHFAALSEELPDVTFVKIMGDHDADTRALMKEWGVRVVPLFMLFRNGEKVTEWSGAKPDVLRENVLDGCTEAEKASMVSA